MHPDWSLCGGWEAQTASHRAHHHLLQRRHQDQGCSLDLFLGSQTFYDVSLRKEWNKTDKIKNKSIDNLRLSFMITLCQFTKSWSPTGEKIVTNPYFLIIIIIIIINKNRMFILMFLGDRNVLNQQLSLALAEFWGNAQHLCVHRHRWIKKIPFLKMEMGDEMLKQSWSC